MKGQYAGSKGVTPEMQFKCMDCDDVISGADVISDSQRLYVVSLDKQDIQKSTVRCECCEEDYREKHCGCDCSI